MFDVFCLSMAMTVGQAGGNPALEPPPNYPQPNVVPSVVPVDQPIAQPRLIRPLGKPQISVDPAPLPRLVAAQPGPMQLPPMDKKEMMEEKKEEKKDEEKKEDEEEKKEEPEPGFLMKSLEGTSIGEMFKERRISISGWTQGSYTASTAHVNNLPVVWNDRANRFLLQQHWMRFERALDTESKCPSYGWRIDALVGSDYRYTMIRGFWNSQLLNSRLQPDDVNGRVQNLYGIDLPQFYANAYLPNLFEGTEIRAGRMFTPWGVESVEGPTSPLLSRSYTFNYAPPFFHMAISVNPKFNKNWSGVFMLANGNDVFFDPAQEARFVGAMTWKSDDEKDTVTFATSVGRGKFNTGQPFNPATFGLQSEGAGRNNINVFDLVWLHTINDKASYAVEAIYGYQTGVPGNGAGVIGDPPIPSGTANWWGVAQYFNYQLCEKLGSVFRAEVFDDVDGQRTGFEGLYLGLTYGVQYKPKDWLWIRPEIRYDYNFNNNVRPFDGGTDRHIWTAATDMIFRW